MLSKLGLKWGASWFNPISNFYRNVETRFAGEWAAFIESGKAKGAWRAGADPELWKVNGDELIFSKEISEVQQVHSCLACWMAALRGYRRELKERHPSLDLKSAAWVAGFPIGNTEIAFQRRIGRDASRQDFGFPRYSNYLFLEQWYSGERGDLVLDFIGPSMDTGFRLCQKADPRRLVVSAEVALLLASAGPPPKGVFSCPIGLHFAGREVLRGVNGGSPYPLFWIDLLFDDPLLRAEGELTGGGGGISLERVAAFCDAFFQEHRNFLFRPFIVGSQIPDFSSMPEHFAENINALAREWRLWSTKIDVERKSLSGEEPEESDGSGRVEVQQNDLAALMRAVEPAPRRGSKHPGALQNKRGKTIGPPKG